MHQCTVVDLEIITERLWYQSARASKSSSDRAHAYEQALKLI